MLLYSVSGVSAENSSLKFTGAPDSFQNKTIMNPEITKGRRMVTKIIALILLIMLIARHASAQTFLSTNTPADSVKDFFSHLPDTIAFNPSALDLLMNRQKGDTVMLRLGDTVMINSIIISGASKYGGKIRAVSMNFLDYPGIYLVFSKSLLPDNQYGYRCMISSPSGNECFFLQSGTIGYYLRKQRLASVRFE